MTDANAGGLRNPFGLSPAEIEGRAREIRRKIILTNSRAGQGHTGADLSETDILATLFFNIMRYRVDQPDDPERDRFILSKGHGVCGMYCTFAEAGIIDPALLDTYLQFDSSLPGHPVRQKTPFVEVNTGALGHGLSVAVGLALSARMKNRGFRVFVLLGDGEVQEGSNCEALMSASHFKLGNLFAIVDRNTLQLADRTETIMALEPLDAKLRSFGFETFDVDGNDPKELVKTLHSIDPHSTRPHALIARTVKGKGVSFIEDQPAWHHKIPVGDQIRQAIEELE